jgi:uncharacterized membrane protein
VKEYLMTFLLSMVPISELRAAIPYGILAGADPVAVWILAVLGNLIPVPLAILFVRVVLKWLRGRSGRLDRMILRFDRKIAKKAKKVARYERLGLLLFVAIPLPGTGAWTGAAIAGVMRLPINTAFWSIFGGLVISATIVTIVTLGGVTVL